MCNSFVKAVSFKDFFQLSFLLGGEGNDPGRFLCPCDIAEDPEGNLYVTDELNNRIQKCSNTGKHLHSFGSKGRKPGEFHYPTSLSVSYRGDIIVTDRWNHRVQVLSNEGNPTSAFGSYGKSSGNFNEPWGLAIASNGNVLIADRGNHRIQIFNQDGRFQHSFGKAGFDRRYYESEEFKSGYTFECWQKTVSRFSPIETAFHDAGYETGNLEFPRWIGPYRDDIFLVIDTSGTIHLVKTEGVFIDRIEIDYSDEKGKYIPASATATHSGTILICDESRNEIIAVKTHSNEKIILKDIPYPVSNLKFLHSGKLALVHCWNNSISINRSKNGL